MKKIRSFWCFYWAPFENYVTPCGGAVICDIEQKEENKFIQKMYYKGGGVLEMQKSSLRTIRTLPCWSTRLLRQLD